MKHKLTKVNIDYMMINYMKEYIVLFLSPCASWHFDPCHILKNPCSVEETSSYWWPTGFERSVSKAIPEAERQSEQRPWWRGKSSN